MDPFVAEIRILPTNFPPKGWAFCDGQLQPISQNTALFSLVGTMYGGDGRSTFALPDLQGSAPMHWGNGPGLSPRFPGETDGSETVTLIQTEMPLHTHVVQATTDRATSNSPDNKLWAATDDNFYAATPSGVAVAGGAALSIAGASMPHNNMQPFLTLSFCIALQGVYPARS